MRPIARPLRTRSAFVIASVAVVGLLVAGCGGGGDEKSATKAKADGRAASADPSTTVAGGDAPTTTTATEGAAVAAASPPSSRVDVSTGLAVRASLASACVRPGGKQTINVDIGQAGGVAYNSYYSDGKTGGSDGFYGGNNGAQVDKSGNYTDTWVVAPNAPPGLVVVDVVAIARSATYDRGQAHLSFTVAKPDGACA